MTLTNTAHSPARLAFAFFVSHGSIQPLDSSRHPSAVVDISLKKTADLPSWTPDFSLSFTITLPTRYNPPGEPVTSPPPPVLDRGLPWNQLPVLIRRIDTVLQTAPTTSRPGDTNVYFSRDWINLTLQLPTSYHGTELSRTEILWRTLVADVSLAGRRPAPAPYGPVFQELVSTMICIAAKGGAERFRNLEVNEGQVLRLPECPSPSLEIAVEHVKLMWEKGMFEEHAKRGIDAPYG